MLSICIDHYYIGLCTSLRGFHGGSYGSEGFRENENVQLLVADPLPDYGILCITCGDCTFIGCRACLHLRCRVFKVFKVVDMRSSIAEHTRVLRVAIQSAG